MSFGAVFGASSVTSNFGRLYSSTLKLRLLRASLRLDSHLAHHPVARRGEAAGERAVIIGAMFGAGDFLAVHVAKHHFDLFASERRVVVLRWSVWRQMPLY